MSGSGHAMSNSRRLWIAIGVIATVLVVEIVGALLSSSLALVADAGHLFSDLTGLIVALVATVVAARPPTDRQTFGFQRAEVFGALVNGLILTAVAVSIGVVAIARLADPPQEVLSTPMLVVALIGLAANLAVIRLLHSAAKSSINMRGAYLEVLGDALGSVAVVAAAVVIMATGFVAADAIASLLIAVLILPRAFSLLRDVVRVLSESAPSTTDVAQIREHILGVEGVLALHDVHVWAITSGAPVFSAHVVVERWVFERGESGRLLDRLADCLAGHFDVAHSTFQLEPVEHSEHEQDFHD